MAPNFLRHAENCGWLVASLEWLLEVGFVIDHLDGNHGNFYPRKEEFVSDGVKYISANAIIGNEIDFSKAKYLSEGRAGTFRKGVAKSGDVIFAHNATVGPVALLETTDEKVILSTSLTYYRPNPEKIEGKYLLQYMASSPFVRQYESIMRQTTRNQIPITMQRHFFFVIPPLDEQRKIAKVLAIWDEAIANKERLLTNSERQRKALMQQLLTGKKRLPGFEGEWPSVTMGHIFRRVTTRNEGQSTNVVTMSGQQGLIRQQEFFKKSVASETLDGYFLLKKGQFAYNKSYSNGYPMGAIKRLNRYEKAVVTTLYICFEIENEEVSDSDYFEHFFEAGLLNHGLSKVANEGGRAHGLLNVKPSDFFSLRVPVPKLKEQKAIARVITAADEDIRRFKQDLELLREEKRALMQQLLTGKRRVKVAENQLASV